MSGFNVIVVALMASCCALIILPRFENEQINRAITSFSQTAVITLFLVIVVLTILAIIKFIARRRK